MRDVPKLCQCGATHLWGILRYSEDNVPLYGAKPIARCNNFREDTEEARALSTMSAKEVGELWAATSFLNPQVPTATRIAVAQLASLGEDKEGIEKVAAQWPEFVGLMMSQLTDMRGAMVRDESKFSHLVAHTDEIVEAMRGVVGLKERLDTINARLDMIGDRSRRPWAIQRLFTYISSKLRNEPIVTDAVNASED